MADFYNSSNAFPSHRTPLASILESAARAKKRRAYFAFHFADIIRVNNVRQAWKIDHPDAPEMRSFYDSSLWERRQLEGPESLKNLIRDGVRYTSAVCVLVSSETWSRRWVRYEIARAVIDGRGLLAAHLNSIRHHVTRVPDPWGPNPLDYVGVGKVQPETPNPFLGYRNSLTSLLGHAEPKYYLFERTGNEWVRYKDYMSPVELPPYLIDPAPGRVALLSGGTAAYDYVSGDGHKNIGSWIDRAAEQVGR